MKNFILFISLINLISVNAQSTSYKVYDDDPSPAKFILNMDIFQLDLAKEISSANFGIWGSYQLINKIGFDYLLEKSYYTSLRKGNSEAPWNLDIETGMSFQLLSFNTNRKIKLQLDYKSNGSTSVTTTIKIPGTIKNDILTRGGLIYKRNPYKTSGDTLIKAQNRTGLYLGLNLSTYKNLAAKVEGYGKRRATGAFSIYADLLFMPVHSISDLTTIPSTDIGSIGYRIGMKFFEAEPEKDGGGYALTQTLQFGSRPYSGFFFTYSIGVSLAIKD